MRRTTNANKIPQPLHLPLNINNFNFRFLPGVVVFNGSCRVVADIKKSSEISSYNISTLKTFI